MDTGDTVTWTVVDAADLDTRTLYDVLVLRSEVFVVEQECAYQDPDGRDLAPDTRHVIGRRGEDIVAYARVLPPADELPQVRIGRVIVHHTARGQQLGRTLMQMALETCGRAWPGAPVELGAQAHLSAFYGSLGFEPVGAPYDEDGILHQWMRLAGRG